MASQEEGRTTVDDLGTTPRAELLSSKFLRKTKFHRPSIPTGDSETSEATYGALDIDAQADNSFTEYPVPTNSSMQPPTTSFTTSGESIMTNKTPSTSLTSPKVMTLSAHSPQISHGTSPPVTDDTTSISSSPRSNSTPDPVMKPPAESAPDLAFPFSPEELDQAKSLVLDLLGWGVDPDYLIASGVSPVAIFRIFNDLNLQLPTNLEISEEIKTLAYSWGPPSDFPQAVD